MRRRQLLAVGVGVAAAFSFVGPSLAGNPGPIPTGDETETDSEAVDCGNGNSLVAVHPTLLWPPNHKYYGDAPNEELHFLATDDEGMNINLTTWATHNQYDDDGAELNGAGNTGDEDGDGIADDVRPWDEGGPISARDDDTNVPAYTESANGSVQTDWAARAERAGTGVRAGVPNRKYTLNAMADFVDGDCTLQITITVPHDMGVGNGNGKKEPVR